MRIGDDDAMGDMSVLLVEDQAPAKHMITQMLKDMGIMQVYTCSDGKEALDFMGSADDLVNFIICDWNMPRMNGVDLLGQLRVSDPDIPFLMVTGVADRESILKAKERGVSGYIAKPFSSEQLEIKVRVLWRRFMASKTSGDGDLSMNDVESLLKG